MRRRVRRLFLLTDRFLGGSQRLVLDCPCGRYTVLVCGRRWMRTRPWAPDEMWHACTRLVAPSPWVIAHLVRCVTRVLGVGVIVGLADLVAIVPAAQLRGVCVNLIDSETRVIELQRLSRRWRLELRRIRTQDNQEN